MRKGSCNSDFNGLKNLLAVRNGIQNTGGNFMFNNQNYQNNPNNMSNFNFGNYQNMMKN